MPGRSETVDPAVADYKRLLRTVLNARPSGTRQRLADALGKNRSFISQVSNPAYPTPIPARHLEEIFATCHFSDPEKETFLAAYDRAHPRKRVSSVSGARTRPYTVHLPDLGDPARNNRLNKLVERFVRDLIAVTGQSTDNAEQERQRP